MIKISILPGRGHHFTQTKYNTVQNLLPRLSWRVSMYVANFTIIPLILSEILFMIPPE